MSESLAARLRARIAADGPLTVAQYMKAALLDPEAGYYTTRPAFGAEGDFITAPEISQVFGEIIGAYLAQAWLALGSPRACLMEAGPGRGTLMRDALRATARVPGFHEAVQVALIEASPAMQARQRRTLGGAHPNVKWQDSLTLLPALPLLFIANEWLDALPIRQFERTGGRWHERLVEADPQDADAFRFTLSSGAATSPRLRGDIGGMPHTLSPMMKEASPLHPPASGGNEENEHPCDNAAQGDDKKDGAIVEICEPAVQAVRAVSRHIARHGGAALLIDYGYTQGSGDTFQAVKSHRPHDPLRAPGSADLTAHVDFAALIRAAEAEGARADVTPQGRWLSRHGAELRAQALARANPAQAEAVAAGVARLVAPDQMGELFKVLAIAPESE